MGGGLGPAGSRGAHEQHAGTQGGLLVAGGPAHARGGPLVLRPRPIEVGTAAVAVPPSGTREIVAAAGEGPGAIRAKRAVVVVAVQRAEATALLVVRVAQAPERVPCGVAAWAAGQLPLSYPPIWDPRAGAWGATVFPRAQRLADVGGRVGGPGTQPSLLTLACCRRPPPPARTAQGAKQDTGEQA